MTAASCRQLARDQLWQGLGARVAPSTHLLEPRCLLDHVAGRRVAGQGLPGFQPVRHLPLQGSWAGVYGVGCGGWSPSDAQHAQNAA